jgi:hypothetical protein
VATRLPPTIYQDAAKLAALRAEIGRIAKRFVGEGGAQGSRY